MEGQGKEICCCCVVLCCVVLCCAVLCCVVLWWGAEDESLILLSSLDCRVGEERIAQPIQWGEGGCRKTSRGEGEATLKGIGTKSRHQSGFRKG